MGRLFHKAFPILLISFYVLLGMTTACRPSSSGSDPSPTPTPTPSADDMDNVPELEAIYVHPDGDDSADGSEATPVKTISAGITKAVAQSLTQVRVAQGTYSISSAISLAAGVSVYGGFKNDDWGTRSISSYETIITDTRTSGGNAVTPIGAVYANSSQSNSVFDGFTVQAGNGSYAAAFFASGAYHQTVSHNTFRGGAATTASYGVYDYNGPIDTMVYNDNVIEGGSAPSSYGFFKYGSAPKVEGNEINGGSGNNNYGVYLRQCTSGTTSENTVTAGGGTNSYGIYITDGGGALVSENIVDGGTGSTSSYGIYVTSATNPVPTIRSNTIYGGSGATSYGIYNVSRDSLIEKNRIHGGNGTNTFGIMINSANPEIYNNLIFGGESGDESVGVGFLNVSSPVIRNNTISGGFGGTGGGAVNRASAIKIPSANSPTFQNNLLFTHGGTNRYCLYEGGIIGTITIQNNSFFDCPTMEAYKGMGTCTADNDGDMNNSTCDIDDINAIANHSGNITVSPTFTDEDGADGNLDTVADNDYSLANSTPSSIKSGGLDGGTLSWEFTDDFTGASRTTSWSIGAYEKD